METQTSNYPRITRAFMRSVLNNANRNVISACQALKAINPNFPADFFIECEGVYESVIDSNILLYGFCENENEELYAGQVIDDYTDIAKLTLILDQQGLIDSFIDYFNEAAIAYKEAYKEACKETCAAKDSTEDDPEECDCCAESNEQENCLEDDEEELDDDNDEDIEEDDEECECNENVHYIPMLDEYPLTYNERQMIRIMRSKNLPTVIQVTHDTEEFESLANFSGMYIPTVDEMALDEKEILMIRTMRLMDQ